MWAQADLIKSNIALGDDPNTEAAVKKLLATFSGHKDTPEAVYQVARKYHDLEKYEKAGQLYQYVIDHWPESKQMILAKADVARSNILLGNEAAAEATVNELIADFNDHPDLPQAILTIGEKYYNLAFQYQNKDSNEQSKECFHKAIAVSERIIKELPESSFTPQAYILLGECYSRLGRHQESLGCYQKVVSNWPNCEYAWYAQFLIGCTYEKLRDSGDVEKTVAYTEIRAAYEGVLRDYPDCPAVRAASNWLNCYVKPSQGGQK